jgi:tripartite-type tricarboxylate transporter receptor subunit TctC
MSCLLPKLVLVAVLSISFGCGASAADFYAGKRMTVLVNFDAGGPTDIEARLLARHLPRHIPGSPTIVVQNMGGAAGLIATKYLGEIAPRDGTVLGYFTSATHRAAFQPERFTVDFRSYEFIAYAANGRIHFMRADVKPGIRSPADLMKAEGLIAGGLGAEGVKDLSMRLLLDILGVKYRYVTGYNSSTHATLALQRGEFNYLSDSPSMYLARVEPTLVKSGEVIPVFTEPGYDGSRFVLPRQLQGVAAPTFLDYYRSVKGGAPSGQLWDAYLALLTVSSTYYRVLVMPPQVPNQAVASLRAATMRLNDDRDYQDEAQKTISEPIEYGSSPTLNDDIRKALTVSPELRAFMDDYIRKGSGG